MDLVSQKKDWTETNIQSADNLSNEQEVLSSCLQVCVDIISMMRHSKWQAAGTVDIDEPVYFTEGEYTIEPFTERFDNMVTGWVFTIGIVVQNDFPTCTIPVDNTAIGK